MKKQKVTNTTKGTVGTSAAGMAGAIGTWAAMKYGVPIEIAVPAVGGLLAFVGRWASKLNPRD